MQKYSTQMTQMLRIYTDSFIKSLSADVSQAGV